MTRQALDCKAIFAPSCNIHKLSSVRNFLLLLLCVSLHCAFSFNIESENSSGYYFLAERYLKLPCPVDSSSCVVTPTVLLSSRLDCVAGVVMCVYLLVFIIRMNNHVTLFRTRYVRNFFNFRAPNISVPAAHPRITHIP